MKEIVGSDIVDRSYCKNNIANLITSIRMICSFLILLSDPFTTYFYLLYIICGLGDIIDGYVARKTNTVSEFGSQLDTIADFVFFIICLFILLPVLNIQTWIINWIIVIALMKLFNMIKIAKNENKFIAIHSLLNKMTGFLLFLFPLTLQLIPIQYTSMLLCLLATFAVIDENYKIKKVRKFK